MLFTTCAVIFAIPGISLMYVAMCSRMVVIMMAAIPDDSVGKKLYAAVAFHTRSSHSMQVSSCFAIVALRNLWNPSILPLYCGE